MYRLAANLLFVHSSDWASCVETCRPQVNLAAARLKPSLLRAQAPLSLHRASVTHHADSNAADRVSPVGMRGREVRLKELVQLMPV